MDPVTGRCAIIFPHGVLFRNEEAGMRHKLVESVLVECVLGLGLGPRLFYNSSMEDGVVVCRSTKPEPRRGKILFIDAVAEIARERALSFLKTEHLQGILDAYRPFADQLGFAAAVPLEDVLAKDGSLSIPLYVKKQESVTAAGEQTTMVAAWAAFDEGGREFWTQTDELADMLDDIANEETGDA
jgi:type I restriction enzyme M protein